jgi:hypothetical protein
MVPGGQDLSRFAGVSPQGGGPIPLNVAQQLQPTVTPPQGMPTLATLGQPQGQMQALQSRFLLDLARTSPDAALKVQQLMQGQEDLALKRDEQRLTMGTRVAEYVGRVAQGVTSPETLEQARQELARIHPQAAAQLPQTYSKEGMVPFLKKAVGVKDNALLQLETWKNQIEMQKAGLQGEPAAMVSELRTMGVNPLQATTDQRQQAQKNIHERELALKRQEGAAAADIRTQADVAARQNQTLAEAFKGETTNLYDTNTGQTLDARMKVQDYEALPAGQVKQLSSDVRKQVEQLNASVPIITQLQTHIDKLYGPGGALARMTPDERADLAAAPGRWAQQYAQKYPELTQAQRFIDANAGALARALAGETGAMNEGDIERAKAMLPSLTTALKVWPPSQLAIQAPDTRAVALGTMNSLVDMINARGQTLLGNERYQHPKLHRYQTAEEGQQASGGPVTPPKVAPPELPMPPLVGPNPTTRAQPGAFGAPEQRRYVPPTPTAPAPTPTAPPSRPTPPTATSTPAQDEAYRQSVAPQPAPTPAPSAPATRPTPGRQSQATGGGGGVRLAEGPKYMDLADVAEAVRQTGKSRREVEAAARSKGYTVYGSKLPLPSESRMS